jgi:LuxR family maltose regulon positive regulatory protein
MISTRPKAQSYIIKRPRLTKLLDESEARIILLCAPAGYGKTTLAREWVETVNGPVAWYSAGPTSDDIASFAIALANAIKPSSGRDDLPGHVATLVSSRQPTSQIAHELTGALHEGAVLVVDDYQRLASSAESDALLEAIASNLERVVLTSRVRPNWLDARSDLYGEVLTIGPRELAFTDDEACGLLKGSSAEQPIVVRAQGWPAVLGLAARRGSADLEESDMVPAELYEFFARDLFRTASDNLRTALLTLAAGADADASVAAVALGSGFEELLNEAADRGFVTRRSSSIEIHPLLRSFLHDRIRELPHPERSRLLEKALSALIDARRWDTCLATVESLPDNRWIVASLDRAFLELLADGRITTLRRWLSLAERQKIVDPLILLASAEIALREGRDSEAQQLGEQAASGLGGNPTRAAHAHLVAARAAHMRDDFDAIAPNAEKAFLLAPDEESRFEALWLAWLNAFERQMIEESASLSEQLASLAPRNPEAALRVALVRGMTDFEHGRINQTVAAWIKASALVPHVRDPLLRTSFLNQFSHATLANAQYDQALEIAQAQIDEATKSGLDFVIDHGMLVKAGASVGIRKLREAHAVLLAIEKRPETVSGYIALSIGLLTAKLRIASGDTETAMNHLLRDPPSKVPPSAVGELLAYRGLLQAVTGDLAGAATSIEAARVASQYVETVTVAELAEAILSAAVSHTSEARAGLVGAIDSVIRSGHHEAVVTAVRASPELVMIYGRESTNTTPLRDILIRSRDHDLARTAKITIPRDLRRGDDLSPRELEVCELILQGRTNIEISRALFISGSTTKVHIRHIYEKLGAHSRAEAVALLLRKDRA